MSGRIATDVDEDRTISKHVHETLRFANYESWSGQNFTSNTAQRVANKSIRVVLRLIRRSSQLCACHGNLFNSGLSTADFRHEKEWNANKI